MNKLTFVALLALVAISAATSLRRDDERFNSTKSGVGAKLINVTVVGPNVNGSMVSYATSQVLTAANQYNLNGSTCNKASVSVKTAMQKKYGATWGVDCIQANMGQSFYTYVNGFNINMLVGSNNLTYFFLIFEQNTNTALENQTTVVRDIKNDQWEQVGAFVVNVYYMGNGVNADMKNNLVNYAVTAASNFNLDITASGTCYHCYETAQSVSLNANFAYRSNWQSEVIIHADHGVYGSAAVTVQGGQDIAMIINSNGHLFQFYLANIRN